MSVKVHANELRNKVTTSASGFLSEPAKDYLFASSCVAVLATLAYSMVNLVLNYKRDTATLDIETVMGYVLIILGYLLLPGVGVLLVRRKRCLARNRVLLMAETDIGDSHFSDAFGRKLLSCGERFGTRQVARDVERATKCIIWGAADDKEVQCSVCLNDVEEESEVRVLPCSHVFHKECADLWLVNGRKNSCPMCMQPVCRDRDGDVLQQIER